MMRQCLRSVILAWVAWILAGCQGSGSYTMEGRVVEGPFSTMEFVAEDDPRLQERGIGNVKIVLHRDGNKSWPRCIGEVSTSPTGMIHFPVKEFGAGWMIEQWLIEAFKPGYETVDTVVTLPSQKSDRRLLIMMIPGQARPLRPRNELLDQYERFR